LQQELPQLGKSSQPARRQPRETQREPQRRSQQPRPQQTTHQGSVADAVGLVSKSVVAVRLRGLPFASKEQDVLAFFAKHDAVERVSEGPGAVQILNRPNGKPTGQALVQMSSREDADFARMVLNGQYMGTRYIEVFLHLENEGDTAHPIAKSGGMQHSTEVRAPGSNAPPTKHLTDLLASGNNAQLAKPLLSDTVPNKLGDASSSPLSSPSPRKHAGDDDPEPGWQALFDFLSRTTPGCSSGNNTSGFLPPEVPSPAALAACLGGASQATPAPRVAGLPLAAM